MLVLEPSNGILAFYDGRDDGATLEGADWVEYDLVLGLASYAIVEGNSALVYDTHTSPDRGEFVRGELERRGVSDFRVVLSHWHLDHIAGAGAFSDCEVIATDQTAEHLTANREAIESGRLSGPPPIDSVVTPTRTFGEQLSLTIGSREAELIHFNIHSDDAAVLWLPGERILFAGDTLEDTVTYVDEPDSLRYPSHRARPARRARARADPPRTRRSGRDRERGLPAAGSSGQRRRTSAA